MSTPRIDKAVVLAAGLGSRMAAVGGGTPKPLLPIDGRPGSATFLDWHISCLSAAGVREIYVVGNARTPRVRLRASETVAVRWISNSSDDLRGSGSAHSAWFAWESPYHVLDGRSRVILMDADIVYDPRLVAELASAQGEQSKILVCTVHRDTQEEVLVFADPHAPEMPRWLGKGLPHTALVEGCACLGEATGITLWEPADHHVLRAVTQWTIRHTSAGTRSEHEDVTQRMMLLDRVRAVCFGAERVFLEVDTPEDYRFLVEEIAPRLRPA